MRCIQQASLDNPFEGIAKIQFVSNSGKLAFLRNESPGSPSPNANLDHLCPSGKRK
jgi:hypothetical protein